MTRVVFLLVPQLHLLDLAGPAQVFSTAADLGLRLPAALRRRAGGRAHRAGRTAAWPGPVARAGPATTWSSCPAGGCHALRTARAGSAPATCGGWPTTTRAGGTVASVCAGADALGRAGLLDGRRCTTHHDLQDELARRYPPAPGRPRRAVRGRRPGGHLRRHRQRHRPGAAPGRHPARAGGRRPGSPARWSSTPGATATSRRPAPCCGTGPTSSDAVHRVQDLIDRRFAEPLPLADLAAAGGVSERTLTRLFRAARPG